MSYLPTRSQRANSGEDSEDKLKELADKLSAAEHDVAALRAEREELQERLSRQQGAGGVSADHGHEDVQRLTTELRELREEKDVTEAHLESYRSEVDTLKLKLHQLSFEREESHKKETTMELARARSDASEIDGTSPTEVIYAYMAGTRHSAASHAPATCANSERG